jgi:hypothetical protein
LDVSDKYPDGAKSGVGFTSHDHLKIPCDFNILLFFMKKLSWLFKAGFGWHTLCTLGW